jgi:hypothetical protein
MHLVAFATPDAAVMLRCWLIFVAAMMDADRDTTYSLEVRRASAMHHVERGSDSYGSEASRWAFKHKVHYMRDVLQRRNEKGQHMNHVIFTDLDVLPLRPFSELARVQEANLQFMLATNPPGHPTGWPVGSPNGGFLSVRSNTPKLRAFFQRWAQAVGINASATEDKEAAKFVRGKTWSNQAALDRLFVCHTDACRARRPEWATFNESILSGEPDALRPETVAYHAVRAGTVQQKLRKFRVAAARHERLFPGASGVSALVDQCAAGLPARAKTVIQ